MAFRTQNPTNREYIANSWNDLVKILSKELLELSTSITYVTIKGSDWDFDFVNEIKIKYYKPTHPFSSGKKYIETPNWLKSKKAVVNIRNKDEFCFKKCLYVHFYYDKKGRNNNKDVTCQTNFIC